MIVMKFGGTSVGGANEIRAVADIVKSNLSRKPVVVVSAVKKVTDRLIELANLAKDGNAESKLKEIKNMHYTILEQLMLDKNLLKKEFEEIESAIKNAHGKKLDLRAMDLFQSFGERMSSKIVAAQLNALGVKAQ